MDKSNDACYHHFSDPYWNRIHFVHHKIQREIPTMIHKKGVEMKFLLLLILAIILLLFVIIWFGSLNNDLGGFLGKLGDLL
ncbi:TPA: hypothetical protein HA278_06490 [Candidatus Woesearchaeota archaeon]|nr:hypothetical protein [Candidatus Woesearchaeota archaeon]